MSKPLKLYQYEVSPYCEKVRRVCALKGIAYETIEVLPTQRSRAKTISPTGKLPAIDDDGTIIVDSSPILRHLDRKWPRPPLFPSEPRDFALATVLEDWADESLYFYDLALRSMAHNQPALAEDILRYEAPLIKRLLGRAVASTLKRLSWQQGLGRKTPGDLMVELNALFDALGGLMGNQPWLAGAQISSADIAVRSMLSVICKTPEGQAARDAREGVALWFARVDATAPDPAQQAKR